MAENSLLSTTWLIRRALREDVGRGDLTTRLTVPARARAKALIVAKAPGVVAGLRVVRGVFRALDRGARFTPYVQDGQAVRKGQPLMRVEGRARALLTGERTALNFLAHLSGIATQARRFVRAAPGVTILDTRKTTPGLRELEKEAVRLGGATNHRPRLDAMVLVKENHIRVAGGIWEAVRRLRRPGVPVEVEAATLAEVREALGAGVRRILLDNMSLSQMRRAAELARGRAELEASGGMTLARVGRVARTGVDSISVGALTHSAPALDVSMEVEFERAPARRRAARRGALVAARK